MVSSTGKKLRDSFDLIQACRDIKMLPMAAFKSRLMGDN
jgi:hypothetical protein